MHPPIKLHAKIFR